MQLAKQSYLNGVGHFSSAWNFGSPGSASTNVVDLLKLIQKKIPSLHWEIESNDSIKEATLLSLSSAKAKKFLDWETQFSINEALDLTIEWYQSHRKKEDIEKLTKIQIKNYLDRVSGF